MIVSQGKYVLQRKMGIYEQSINKLSSCKKSNQEAFCTRKDKAKIKQRPGEWKRPDIVVNRIFLEMKHSVKI